jgi:hypothetical protein
VRVFGFRGGGARGGIPRALVFVSNSGVDGGYGRLPGQPSSKAREMSHHIGTRFYFFLGVFMDVLFPVVLLPVLVLFEDNADTEPVYLMI